MSKDKTISGDDGLDEAKKGIKDVWSQAIDAGKSATHDAAEKVEGLVEDAEDVLANTLKQGKKLVKKHPVEAVLIGFGIGCLVGACLTRRN